MLNFLGSSLVALWTRCSILLKEYWIFYQDNSLRLLRFFGFFLFWFSLNVVWKTELTFPVSLRGNVLKRIQSSSTWFLWHRQYKVQENKANKSVAKLIDPNDKRTGENFGVHEKKLKWSDFIRFSTNGNYGIFQKNVKPSLELFKK